MQCQMIKGTRLMPSSPSDESPRVVFKTALREDVDVVLSLALVLTVCVLRGGNGSGVVHKAHSGSNGVVGVEVHWRALSAVEAWLL